MSDENEEATVITRQQMTELLSNSYMEGYAQGVDHGITMVERALKVDLSLVHEMAKQVAKAEKEHHDQQEDPRNHEHRRDSDPAERSGPVEGSRAD